MFEEVEPDHVAVKRYMKYVAAKGTSWATVAEREVSYKVKADKSGLVVEYADTYGTYRARTGRACDIRLLMNNVDAFGATYTSSTSDRGGSNTFPTSMRWTIPATKVKKDATYKFSIQVKRYIATTQCMFGNVIKDSANNAMTVTEIPAKKLAFRASTAMGSFKLYRTTGGGWKSIPGRLVQYTKKDPASVLRITYADTIGFKMSRHTSAIILRVLINGKTYGTKQQWSHSGTKLNYREDPKIMTWICTKCTFKGNAKFQIQVAKQGGASEYRLGYPIGKIGDLTVEEIPKA